MDYHYTVMRREHDYGEIISSINFEEKVFHEIEENNFVKGLAKFLKENREVSNPDKKAEKIFRKQEAELSKKEVIEAVKQAIEEGYIWKFKLEEPWHPAIYFDENRLTTIPWQHKFAVLYSGRTEYEFYSKEFLKKSGSYVNGLSDVGVESVEDLHNAESVLRTGYIKPGVRWANSAEEAEEKAGNDHTRSWAIYLAIQLNKVSSYAGSNFYGLSKTEPVLEIEVPTKFLRMPGVSGVGLSRNFISSIDDYFKDLSSPKQFYDAYANTEGESEIQFTKTFENMPEYPVLPLNYVNGVWDFDKYNTPYFVPLKEYVDRLYEIVPDKRLPNLENIKMDVGTKNGSFKRNNLFEREKKELFGLLDELTKGSEGNVIDLYEEIIDLEKNLSNLREGNSQVEEFSKFVEELKDFESRRENIIKYLEKENYGWESKQVNMASFLQSRSQEDVKEYSNSAEERLKRYKKLLGSQKINSEESISKVEKRMQEDLNKILSLNIDRENLFVIAEKVADTEEEYQRYKNILEIKHSGCNPHEEDLEILKNLKRNTDSLWTSVAFFNRLESELAANETNSRMQHLQELNERASSISDYIKDIRRLCSELGIDAKNEEISIFQYINDKSFDEIRIEGKKSLKPVDDLIQAYLNGGYTEEELNSMRSNLREKLSRVSSLRLNNQKFEKLGRKLSKNEEEFQCFVKSYREEFN
jgi:hypothetical protein